MESTCDKVISVGNKSTRDIFSISTLRVMLTHGRYYATIFLEKAILNNAVKEHMCHHCVYLWHSNFRYRKSAFTTVPSSIVHYNDVIMSAMASQITSLTIVYSTVYSDANQRKHQSSASLAFCGGIHRSPVNSPYKGPVTPKRFPFDGVIMFISFLRRPTGTVMTQFGFCTLIFRGPALEWLDI